MTLTRTARSATAAIVGVRQHRHRSQTGYVGEQEYMIIEVAPALASAGPAREERPA
jgi:hypothetical protein